MYYEESRSDGRADQMNHRCQFLMSQLIHEIRNPLTLIYSSLQFLELDHPELQADALWHQIRKDVQDTICLLRDLSPSSGQEHHPPKPFLPAPLLERTASSCRSFMQSYNVHLAVDIDPSLPPVLGSEIRLREALLNLLLNACEAAAPRPKDVCSGHGGAPALPGGRAPGQDHAPALPGDSSFGQHNAPALPGGRTPGQDHAPALPGGRVPGQDHAPALPGVSSFGQHNSPALPGGRVPGQDHAPALPGDRRSGHSAAPSLPGGSSSLWGEVFLSAHTEGGRIRIHVRDNGPGIPEAYQNTLFEDFVTHKEGGTGLGLGIVRETALQHGGSLTFTTDTSPEDSFTDFCLSLPAVQ